MDILKRRDKRHEYTVAMLAVYSLVARNSILHVLINRFAVSLFVFRSLFYITELILVFKMITILIELVKVVQVYVYREIFTCMYIT